MGIIDTDAERCDYATQHEDVKAGQEQDWHRVQVMIYMYAIPRAMPQYRNFSIAGEVVYPHGMRRISQGGLPTSFT